MTEIILTSSVLILLLVILRRVLRGRISPCVQYALWLLVAVRLLIPGALFTAPVSVLGAAEELQTTLHETFPDPDNLPEPLINDIMTQLPAAQPALPAHTEHSDRDTVVTYAPAVSEITQRVYNWPDIIWKTGMAVTGSALVLSNLTFCLRLRKKRKPLALPAAPWSGNLPVYEAEGLPSPCLFGVLRPSIYLNTAAMSAAHPEHILAHEYAHYCHADHLWSILRSICLVIHWYNPLVWWAAALSRRDCELACDAAALKRLGKEERIDYGHTLLGMVSKRTSPAALLHTATTMTAGKRAMTERIALIIKQPKTKKITLVLVAALACLLAACTFSGRAAEEPVGDEPPVQSPAEAGLTALPEFPGLHWNDSLETVMETLGVTQEDFISRNIQGADGDEYCAFEFSLESPAFDPAVQFAVFHFSQYAGTGHGLGLDMITLSYPNDMEDFGALREELVRQYGQAGELENGPYTADIIERSLDDHHAKREIDAIVGRDLLSRWEELMEQTGPHYFFWDAGTDALPESQAGTVLEFYRAQDGQYAYPGTWSEYAPEFPVMVRVSWSDRSLWQYTFNQITYDARTYVAFLRPAALVPQPDSVETNASIVVRSVQQGADPSEWLPYLNYIDWADIRQDARPDAWPDAAEIEQAIIDSIWLYIGQQDIALTQGEYMSILTATAGLTGTPKEGNYHSRSDNVFPTRYGDIVYKLYSINPSMFAYVVLEQLPEEQRSEVLDFFRYEAQGWIEWDRGDRPGAKQAPSQEEAIATLELELERSVTATPSEMVLTVSGQSFQFLPVNAYGVYAAIYTSSDPSVAEAAQDGTVTAVDSGEADITMHFEGAQGQQDFVCHVRCDLEYSSASIAASIRSYVQAGISPREWLLLLGGVSSWGDIAVPPEGDNRHDWISDVQRAIYNYILDSDGRGGTPLTDLEIFTLMTFTNGLDGAYSEGYSWILYTLYNQYPTRFAIIALGNLSPEQRSETLGMLLYDWGFFHQLDGLPYQERFDLLLAQLEEDQKGELKLSPDALVFDSVGQVWLVQIVNSDSLFTFTYANSDPEVVSVNTREDGRFELKSVGPGEATLTVHCVMRDDSAVDLVCSVRCAW